MREARVHMVIVDDHPALRERTRALLERQPALLVIGATGHGRAALRLAAVLRPDVVLLDIHLPDMSGVEVARQPRATQPEVAVLVLSSSEEPGYIRALLQLGARGYLGKTAWIAAAIRTVAQGTATVLSETARAAVGGGVPLSARELEVLQRLAAGRRNGEIAGELGISENTVEFHVRRVLRKLGARSRSEAMRLARRQWLVPPQTPVGE